MKTQSINNINFKALYVKDFDYDYPQQCAINNIRNGLDKDSIDEIAAKGFDVFIENNPESKDEVTVSAIKGFSFTDEYAEKECRKIVVGNYGAEELCSEFSVNDIHSKIDEFTSTLKKANKFAKVIFGILVLSGLTLLSILIAKAPKSTVGSNIQKAKIEMLHNI